MTSSSLATEVSWFTISLTCEIKVPKSDAEHRNRKIQNTWMQFSEKSTRKEKFKKSYSLSIRCYWDIPCSSQHAVNATLDSERRSQLTITYSSKCLKHKIEIEKLQRQILRKRTERWMIAESCIILTYARGRSWTKAIVAQSNNSFFTNGQKHWIRPSRRHISIRKKRLRPLGPRSHFWPGRVCRQRSGHKASR